MDRKIITDLTDLRRLNWTRIRHSSGTAGSFLKAYENRRGRRLYYKLSDFDAYKGIVGHECVNEIIADRLLNVLQIPHLSYQLIHALITLDGKEYETWLCCSEDYKARGESKIALDAYYQLERRENESPLQFCIRNGWKRYIEQMLAVDFLILNRDRHGANMEVLRNRDQKTIRLAPLFDHGLSFYFSVHDPQNLAGADPLADRRVQSFVGSNSALGNLLLMPKVREAIPGTLKKDDREYLMNGIGAAIPHQYLEAIWDMIWRRWNFYEDLCHP